MMKNLENNQISISIKNRLQKSSNTIIYDFYYLPLLIGLQLLRLHGNVMIGARRFKH